MRILAEYIPLTAFLYKTTDQKYMRAYKFRIYPSKAQEKQMLHHLWLSKQLWNELLEHCKRTYNDFGYFPTKNTLQLMVKDYGMFSQTQQEVAHRLHNSLMRVFMMRKTGMNCGFPRFKSFDGIKSIYYPQNNVGFRLDNKLAVNPFGEIKIKKHREIKGNIKTMALKREPSGKWFVIFTANEQKEPIKANFGEAVGIDLGLINFAALSNSEIIANPRHIRKYEDALALLQRELSKKKKRSKNRRKAQIKVARAYEKLANTRRDFLHKLSSKMVSAYSLIALEKLASQEMAEQNFGKSINDAGWNMFASMIAYKAESAGCKAVFVNPKDTTKECSNCGTKTEKALSERTHICPSCGLSVDRDINAARVILKRATVGMMGSNASGDERMLSSLKEEAHAFRRG